VRSEVTYYLQEQKGKGEHCDMYMPHVETYSPLCTVLCSADSTFFPRSTFVSN